jgi:hypothetical protein
VWQVLYEKLRDWYPRVHFFEPLLAAYVSFMILPWITPPSNFFPYLFYVGPVIGALIAVLFVRGSIACNIVDINTSCYFWLQAAGAAPFAAHLWVLLLGLRCCVSITLYAMPWRNSKKARWLHERFSSFCKIAHTPCHESSDLPPRSCCAVLKRGYLLRCKSGHIWPLVTYREGIISLTHWAFGNAAKNKTKTQSFLL